MYKKRKIEGHHENFLLNILEIALLFKIKRWNIINIQENLDKVEGVINALRLLQKDAPFTIEQDEDKQIIYIK